MFTHGELLANLPSLLSKAKPPIEVLELTQHDFPSGSTEEFIEICRGVKSDFENAMHFWVVAQQYEDWSGGEEDFLPYLNQLVCQRIEERDFILMLSQTQGLKHPVVITPKGKYIWGQQMADEWNDSSAVAEFEHEYLSFRWETTA